jgi:hypothetical protein
MVDDVYVITLRRPGASALEAIKREGSFPAARYGTRCACCSAETTLDMVFDPSTGYAATPIKIPMCTPCYGHVRKSNPIAALVLALAGVLLLALAWKNGVVFGVLGGIALAAAAAVVLVGSSRQAKLYDQGHHVGLQIVALPGRVVVRTTNPTFAEDLLANNPELIERRG